MSSSRPGGARLDGRGVVAEFKRRWTARCRAVPAYASDVPAMRQAFVVFLDELLADDRITLAVLNRADLPEGWSPRVGGL